MRGPQQYAREVRERGQGCRRQARQLAPLRLTGYPWAWAGIVVVASFLGYFLLPLLVPKQISGEPVTLLLGIVTGIAVGVGLRLPLRLLPPLVLGAGVAVVVRFSLDNEFEFFVVAAALVVAAEIAALVILLRRSGAWRLRETGDLLRYGLIAFGVIALGGLVVATAARPDADLPGTRTVPRVAIVGHRRPLRPHRHHPGDRHTHAARATGPGHARRST